MPPPDSLRQLASRFDPSTFDAPGEEATLRLRVEGEGEWDATVREGEVELEPGAAERRPDALLSADRDTWGAVASDVSSGLEAYARGRLVLRKNLHLGVGFLAATSGDADPGALAFRTVRTPEARFSLLEAGAGEPIVMLHGLGATKVSFLPPVAALARAYRTIAVDLPGFGDSGKPLRAPYDPPFFARSIVALLDALGIERAHVIGHSLGGRAALEVGLTRPERVRSLILLAPSLAWLRPRPWAPFLRVVRPELGAVQPAPRRVVEAIVRRVVPAGDSPWAAAGIDEFLRAYMTPRGRSAFYAAARAVYLEDPEAFWGRLSSLAAPALFVWGRRDTVVPPGFARHVARRLPRARHLELDCGHVLQMERPAETTRAIEDFLGAGARAEAGRARSRA